MGGWPILVVLVACGSPGPSQDRGTDDLSPSGDSDGLRGDTGSGDHGGDEPDTFRIDVDKVDPQLATWTQVMQRFEVSCAPCHLGPTPPNGQFDLDGGWSAVVSVASVELPSMLLVDPGSPSTSYLWRKLQGTHDEAGGLGRRMPLSRPALTPHDLAIVKRWIVDGAKP